MPLETESDEFLESFVESMEKMGYTLDEIASKYHVLRVRERLETDPDFAEGFEKAASKARLLARVGAGIAGVPAAIAGASGLVSGTNPFTAFGSTASGAPRLKIEAPGGGRVSASGAITLGRDTALESALRHRGTLDSMDKRIQELQERASGGSGLEGALDRRRASSELRRLNRDRSRVQSQFLRDSRDWNQQTSRAAQSLQQQESSLQAALARQGQRADRMSNYLNRTDGNRFARLWHGMPGVNPERRAERILASQRSIEQDLQRINMARKSLNVMTGAQSSAPQQSSVQQRDRMLGGR